LLWVADAVNDLNPVVPLTADELEKLLHLRRIHSGDSYSRAMSRLVSPFGHDTETDVLLVVEK
jgi:hypothetical protein